MSDVRLKCIYGNRVTLKNDRTGQILNFDLVHYNDEKLKQNKISNYTSIGKAIWAKEEGAQVSFEWPGFGQDNWTIEKIENA